MRVHLPFLALGLVLVGTTPIAAATPAACDATTLAALRAAGDSCDCNAAGHGAYVKCVVMATKAAAKGLGASKACEHEAKKCAARSTCGRSNVAACVTTSAAGTRKCTIRKDTACKAAKGATACAATEPSCCDATCGG